MRMLRIIMSVYGMWTVQFVCLHLRIPPRVLHFNWVVCQFVCLSVCLSGLYLAGRAFIRSTNDATYLAGNEVENVCLKRLRCRAGVLPVLYS